MFEYMDHTHPDAFKGMKKLPPYQEQYPASKKYLPPEVECPKCKGHGGWNLRLDAYGKGNHFRAGCGQCNGWGWVKKGSLDQTCLHEYEEMSKKWCDENGINHFGMCYHVTKCKHCDQIFSYDSSG